MVKKKGPVLTEAQQLAADRVQSLRSAVFTGGLFASEKPTEYPKLAPSNGTGHGYGPNATPMIHMTFDLLQLL